MTIGIVGLGLIGGSFAKAYHAQGWRVLGCDTNRAVLETARGTGAVNGELTAQTAAECDLILLTAYPRASVEWLRGHADAIGKQTVVVDCCGVKREVCAECFPIAEAHGFPYVGGHPMAGTHNSGFAYAREDLYRGAPMVLVPRDFDDTALIARVKELLAPAGFTRFSVTTAEQHDQMIAFTSQLAHIVSSAYVKSPEAQRRRGFSAGSFRDMTRVARLDEAMWTELFLCDADFLTEELEILLQNLTAYRDALRERDPDRLQALLKEGRLCKASVGGN